MIPNQDRTLFVRSAYVWWRWSPSPLFAQKFQYSRKPEIFFYPALPNGQYAPACTPEFPQRSRIALPIGSYLVYPKIHIAFRDGSSARTEVPVPEATVYQDDLFPTREYDIGRAGQSLHMQSVAITELMKSRPDRHFWFSVPTFDPGHQATALFDCELIQLDECSSIALLPETG